MSKELKTVSCPATGKDYRIHQSSYADEGSQIGEKTTIWHFSHIMKGAKIGSGCNIGQNVFIAEGVEIGDNVKIQNNVSVYKGTIIEDEVFLGPSCVLTNVINPRSEINRRTIYDKTLVKRGATIGANSTIVCGVQLGCYCFVAAGAVVTKDVSNYSLVMGNPARHAKWIGRQGVPLRASDQADLLICPETRFKYKLENGTLTCLDLDEYEPLPEHNREGKISYTELRKNSSE